MSQDIRSAAAAAHARATEGYWVRRETRQFEAAQAGLEQLDTLSPSGGDAESLRLIKAAVAASTDRPQKLAVLQEGLSTLAAGAAAGAGFQASLAVRLAVQSGGTRAVADALLKEVAAMAPTWGADGAKALRIAAYAGAHGAKDTLQSLSQGGPKTASEEAALAIRVSSDSARALQDLLAAHPLPAAADALAEAQKLQVDVPDALLRQIAKDPADRLAFSAAVAAELPTDAGGEALARLALKSASKEWKPILKAALAIPAPDRDAVCTALLAGHAGEEPDAETFLRAAIGAVEKFEDPALVVHALDAADQARGANPWHDRLRAAFQADPQMGYWVARNLQEPAPTELWAVAAAAADALETSPTGAAILTAEVSRLAASAPDADQRAAGALAGALAQVPWTDADSSVVRAVLNSLPEAADPPAATASPFVLASAGVQALEAANSSKDVELAGGVVLKALAALNEPDVTQAVQLVQAALPTLPNDHAQKAALIRILPDLLAGNDSYYPTQLLSSLLDTDDIDNSVRVAVGRGMLPALAGAFPGELEAERLTILDRMTALDLESDSVRRSLMTNALYATLPEDTGIRGVAATAAACASESNLSAADAEAVTAAAVDAVRRWADRVGRPEQAAQLTLLERVFLDNGSDSAPEIRQSLLTSLAEAEEDRQGPGWCASVALNLLPQDDETAVRIWSELGPGVAELTPEGPARELVSRLVSRKVETADDVIAALESLARLEDGELIRMIGGSPEDPGEIAVEEEQVTIGGVTVGRNRGT